MKLVVWPATIVAIAALSACGPKTNYGEAQSQPSNAKDQQPTEFKVRPQGEISPQSPVSIPDFLDQKTLHIKDLPPYPGSGLVTISYGPLKGADQVSAVDMVAVTLQTRDPFQKVAQFYDIEVKKKGWQLKSDARNPEDMTLRLIKNQGKDEAIVEIKKEGDVVYISLRRFGNPRKG